jgi:hypothetical protein
MAWVLGGVVGLAGIYSGGAYWFGEYDGSKTKIANLQKQIKLDNENIENGKKAMALMKQWGIQTINPAQPDTAPTDAMVREYYHNSGLTISSWAQAGLRPASSIGTKDAARDFMECRYTATATTSTARLARFLQTIENLSIPARIDGITITTPKPGIDQLRVEINISALLYAPKVAPASTGKNASTAASRSATGTRAGTTTRGTKSQAAGQSGTAKAEDPNDTSAVEKRMAEQRAAENARLANPAAATSAAAPTSPKTPEQMEQEMAARRARELGTAQPAVEISPTSTKPMGGNP